MLLFSSGTVYAAQTPRPIKETGSYIESSLGLISVVFRTGQGKIIVNLPQIICAGDTISGTIQIAPAGKTSAEEDRNASFIDQYSVTVGDLLVPVKTAIFKLKIGSSEKLSLQLHKKTAKNADFSLENSQLVEIPVQAKAAKKHEGKDLQAPFLLAAFAQQGKPFLIEGPFDGDFSNTHLKIDHESVFLLAESPRALVAEAPSDISGLEEVSLGEKEETTESTMNIISVTLTADSGNLQLKQAASLILKVKGLEKLASPAQLQIENQTPDVVSLAGGDLHTIALMPGYGKEFVQSWKLSPRGPGDFHFSARIINAGPITAEANNDAMKADNEETSSFQPAFPVYGQEKTKAPQALPNQIAFCKLFGPLSVKLNGSFAYRLGTAYNETSMPGQIGAERLPNIASERTWESLSAVYRNTLVPLADIRYILPNQSLSSLQDLDKHTLLNLAQALHARFLLAGQIDEIDMEGKSPGGSEFIVTVSAKLIDAQRQETLWQLDQYKVKKSSWLARGRQQEDTFIADKMSAEVMAMLLRQSGQALSTLNLNAGP